MIKLNIDTSVLTAGEKEGFLLWAKKAQYIPSSVDLTKAEQMAEFLTGVIKGNVDRANDRVLRQAITPSDVEVQVAV